MNIFYSEELGLKDASFSWTVHKQLHHSVEPYQPYSNENRRRIQYTQNTSIEWEDWIKWKHWEFAEKICDCGFRGNENSIIIQNLSIHFQLEEDRIMRIIYKSYFIKWIQFRLLGRHIKNRQLGKMIIKEGSCFNYRIWWIDWLLMNDWLIDRIQD